LVENDIDAIMKKLDTFESSVMRDDECIEDIQNRTNHVCDMCKLARASKIKTKNKPNT
jgi:hypothetical protein